MNIEMRVAPPPLPAGFWVGLGLLACTLLWAVWRRSAGRGAPAGASPDHHWHGRVGPYHLVRPLGQGAFATTYLARHRGSGRKVALKILHPHHDQDPEMCWRIHQEAELGRRLDHPGVAAVLDWEPGPEPGWVALDYVAGPTLEQCLAARGRLGPAEAAAIALDLARALAHAHARGVVHRDLKPGNVILGPGGATLTDLGAARSLESADPATDRTFLGTPAYAAPEAWERDGAGPAGDRYSLGVVLFEMLAGRLPFPGPTAQAFRSQHRHAPVPDLGGQADLPPALADLAERLLDKDPARRPGAADLVAILEGVRRIGR